MQNIIILYNDAGGGHKAAAIALQNVLINKNLYRVELFNPYKDFGANIDIIKKVTGRRSEDVYNKVVSSRPSAMLSLLVIAGIFKLNLALFSKRITREFQKLWQRKQPTVVISVSPFINKYVARSIMRLPNKIPFITLVTDYSECSKGVWLVGKEQNVICASQKMVRQALQRNVSRSNIYKVSGMVVDQKFYTLSNVSKDECRKKLNLKQSIFTGIVTFGSHGTKDLLQIAKNLDTFDLPLQIIFICGNNILLQRQLLLIKPRYKKVIVGFVDNMHEYMRAADFMIGKPGGLSISEAAVIKLPMIVKNNMFTLLQERYNARWIEEQGIGICVKCFGTIKQDLMALYSNIDDYINNYSKLENRAIFEIPKIVEALL